MDRLEAIIEKQRELQARVDDRYMSDDPAVRAAFMRDHRGYLADEVAEALYEMPNYKLWKDYNDMSPEKREVQWQKVRMELVDSLHFFVNLLIGAGMTAEEVYQMYMAKNSENHRRQDAGYTSEVSYRDQAVGDVMDIWPDTETFTEFIEMLSEAGIEPDMTKRHDVLYDEILYHMEDMKKDKFNDHHHIGRFSLINKLHSQLGYTDSEIHRIMDEVANELGLRYTNYYGGGYTWQ